MVSGAGLRFVWARATFCNMARPKPGSADVQAAALSIPERVLLFCVASNTEWERAGITGALVTSMVIKGLIAREPTGGLYLTKEGRAVLAALLQATA
jgi:hypothetical protein